MKEQKYKIESFLNECKKKSDVVYNCAKEAMCECIRSCMEKLANFFNTNQEDDMKNLDDA